MRKKIFVGGKGWKGNGKGLPTVSKPFSKLSSYFSDIKHDIFTLTGESNFHSILTLFKITILYTCATICTFISFTLIPPGQGISTRAAAKCTTTIILSKYYNKEEKENKMKKLELLFGFPIGILGIFVLMATSKSTGTVSGELYFKISTKNTGRVSQQVELAIIDKFRHIIESDIQVNLGIFKISKHLA